MKRFVINLKERPERLAQFKRLGLPFDCEVVEAVKDIDGSLGCIKSHLKCFELFDDGVNIIFEDDCLQVADIEVMNEAIKELGDEWDMLYLGAMLHGEVYTNTKHTDTFSGAWTTHAIAYNGTRVSNHLLQFKPEYIRATRKNIDTFIVYEIQKNTTYKCFITNPQVFIQDLNFSDVINEVRDY